MAVRDEFQQMKPNEIEWYTKGYDVAKSEGWSVSQKEAILKAVFRWEDGLKGNTQPAHNEKLLERLEAITKGEQ